jgi:hypothetical protein
MILDEFRRQVGVSLLINFTWFETPIVGAQNKVDIERELSCHFPVTTCLPGKKSGYHLVPRRKSLAKM